MPSWPNGHGMPKNGQWPMAQWMPGLVGMEPGAVVCVCSRWPVLRALTDLIDNVSDTASAPIGPPGPRVASPIVVCFASGASREWRSDRSPPCRRRCARERSPVDELVHRGNASPAGRVACSRRPTVGALGPLRITRNAGDPTCLPEFVPPCQLRRSPRRCPLQHIRNFACAAGGECLHSPAGLHPH